MASRRANRGPAAQTSLVRAALDSMSPGVCVWDSEFRLAFHNAAYRRLYRLKRDALWSGMTLLELVQANVAVGNYPGRTAEDVVAAYRKRICGDDRRRVDSYERLRDDGRTIRVTSKPIRGGAWVTIFEDITQIKGYIDTLREREEEIIEQNMRFDFAVNNMRQGLCMFDADQRLVFWNRQYAEMYNIPHEKIRLGDTLAEVLDQRAKAGNLPIGGNDAFVRDRVYIAGEERPSAFVVKMEDGRAISILHQPMRGGGWVATHFDITEERRNEEHIHHLARHDALTGLPNRVFMHERMEDLEARVARGDVMAVFCVDLDYFKTTNDTLGHAVGDELLKEVAARLTGCVRGDDVVARIGGDEFTVLHGPLKRPEDAAFLAGRIVDAIAEPFVVQSHQIAIGASVGIAIAPNDGRNADALLKAADLACYRAKRDGRGSFDFFEKSMDAPARERREVELWLRPALARRQFSLDFQPIFDLRTDKISGLEALLRWRHPEGGLIPPAKFIPVAEDTGLIVPIGEWVLREACRVAASWPAHVKLAVNLSAVQFKKNGRVAETVISAIASAGLDPGRLELEITESVLLFQIDGVLRTLHQLRELGVRICMDDFGTGYSSLSYLRAFPFDKIKIDRSFIQDSSIRADGTAIVQAVVGLGKSLGMSITAEGVETPEQLRLVRLQGCDEAQGYLLGRPCSSERVAELLERQRSDAPPEIMSDAARFAVFG